MLTPSFLRLTSDHAVAASAIHAASFPKAWPAEELSAMLAIPGTYGFLALRGEEPIGFILCRTLFEDTEILTLAILPAEQRQGVAKALLAQAVQEARVLSASRMLLEVSAANVAAQQLYLAGGFVISGKRSAYYAATGTPEDALLMEYRFA